jgi:hypothetical protein
MEHAEFVRAWNERTRNISVNRSKALRAVNSGLLPKQNQYAHIFWSWVWFLTFPVGIAIMVFQKWRVGIIFLLFVPWSISAAVKKSAMEFIVEHALENPTFYDFTVANGIITIE